jgi:hypothetical protein
MAMESGEVPGTPSPKLDKVPRSRLRDNSIAAFARVKVSILRIGFKMKWAA